MMHTKTLVVDGTWSMFGSANFDNRSLELNDELNVAVTDPAPSPRASSRTSTTISGRRHASTSQQWRRRSMLEKSREQFWTYFGEIF